MISIKKYFRDLTYNISLRVKLILLFLVVILLTSACVALFSYKVTEDVILKQTEESTTAYLSQVSKRLDLFLENIHKATMIISFNRDLNDMITRIDDEGDEVFKSISRNMDLMITYANANRTIYLVKLYNFRSDFVISSSGNKNRIDKESEEYRLIKKMFDERKEILYYKWIETRELNLKNKPLKLVSFIMPIIPSNPVGAVIVYIKESNLCNIYSENNDIIKKGTIYLVNNESKVISSINKEMIGKALSDFLITDKSKNMSYYIKYINGEKCLITYMKSDYTDWVFFSIIPIKKLMEKNITAMKNTFILIFLITVIISFLISSILNIYFYRPVKVLIRKIKEHSIDSDPKHLYLSRRDEIGFIFNSFNEVLNKNKELFRSIYDQKLLLKDSEIRLLHSQINSHFLYNSLDSIIWMAKFKNYEKIVVLVNAMVDFFRISLDKGNEFIKVSKVKEQIESFFAIQRIRYADRLKVEIDIEPSMYANKMMKLLLQPIVENSVQHGIEAKSGTGLIRVIGRKENEILIFVVMDNGVGVSKERLDEVNQIINAEDQEEEKFSALQNINRRIKMFYGKEYGIQIESQEGEGTTVRIRIPVLEQEKYF